MKTLFSKSRSILLGGMLALLTLFAACKHDDHNNISPDVAGFMAFNLIGDQPAVGVSLSGNVVGAPLPYMSYTGGYVRIFPGTRSADAFSGSNANTLATTTFTYKPKKYYSLFMMGKDGSYKNVVVDDGLDTLDAADGKSYVRFVNAISGNAADINVSNDSAQLYADQADFSAVSPFMALDSGAITISVKQGSKADAKRTIHIDEQKAYTVLLDGNPDSDKASDTLQIRYIINGTVTRDSTADNPPEKSE